MDNHKHSHDHNHNIENISGVKLLFVVVLNFIITASEIVGGLLSGSLSLLSDSAHNLSDTISLILSYIATKISKKPTNIKKTYGYKRIEIIVAFINSAMLMAICIFLIIEAVKRFFHPETINDSLMLIIAIIGLLGNLFSIILLFRDSKKSLNIKSSFLHLLGDTVSSVGVIIGAILIKILNIFWIDPILTVLISLYIIKESFGILKKAINIMMQSSADIDYQQIKKEIEEIENVRNIHHIHSWLSNENTIYFEAHIELVDMLLSQTEQIYKKIEHILVERYGVSHITLQFECDVCCDKKFIGGNL